MKLGDRVIWRSSSHRWWTEKVGTVIFMGKSGWKPERPPRDGWLDDTWRETVKHRRPEYQELVDRYPAPGGRGGYVDPKPRGYWTSRSRFRFEKCTSGVVIAVTEIVQLNPDTAQHTFKKPKKPVFYSPSIESRSGATEIIVWPEGTERPTFDIPAVALEPELDPVTDAKQAVDEAKELIRNARILSTKELIVLLACQGGVRVPKEDWPTVEALVEVGYLSVIETMRYAEPTLAGMMLIKHIQALRQDGEVLGNLNVACAMMATELENAGGFEEVLERPAVKQAVQASRAYLSAAMGLRLKTG